MSPGEVLADRLTLRWTITDAGAVSDATAVGTAPVDAGVLEYVKRQMTGWRFTVPSGGPLPIERVFQFRPLPGTGDSGGHDDGSE